MGHALRSGAWMPVVESHMLPAIVLDKSAGRMGDVCDAPILAGPAGSSFDIPDPIFSIPVAPGVLPDGELPLEPPLEPAEVGHLGTRTVGSPVTYLDPGSGVATYYLDVHPSPTGKAAVGDDGVTTLDLAVVPAVGLAGADLQPALARTNPLRPPRCVAAGQSLLPHRGHLRRGVSAKDEGYYHNTA